jgi:N-carbamoyl-L-amino-acid hydrolase
VVPGGTNVIASRVIAWLDARSPSDRQTRDLVADIEVRIRLALAGTGCSLQITEESWSGLVTFDPTVAENLATALGGTPLMATGAGHDAGVLAALVPSAMVFVRNPTGVSHSPEEFAEAADCVAGVSALERMLRSVL